MKKKKPLIESIICSDEEHNVFRFFLRLNRALSLTQLYLQLIRKMREIKALFINSNERQTEKEMQGTEKNRQRECREGVFWKEHRIVKTLSFLMSTVSRVASAVPAYETD